MSQRFDVHDREDLAMIAKHGWMIHRIFQRDPNDGVDFYYTSGLTAAGRPELIVSGLPDTIACKALNGAAKRSVSEPLSPGDVLEGIVAVPLKVIEAPTAPVHQAERLYGEGKVTALQLLWPDKAGLYPTDEEWPYDWGQELFR